jgi:hypothetical protein
MRRAAAPQRRRLLRVLLVRLGPLPAEAGGRVPSQMSTRRARKAIAWPSVASSKVSRMARRVVARKPSDKRDGVAPAATLDRTSRTTPLPPSESVTLHTKSVTVRTGGRAVSVVNLRLRDAAPSVNVTVGQRSREYLTDREVERLIEAAKHNRSGHRDATRLPSRSWRVRR